MTESGLPARLELYCIQRSCYGEGGRGGAGGLAEVAPPTGGLVPGMTVDVEILIDASPRALQVPIEAVFSDPVGSHVYRLDDGRVRETRVRLGRATVSSVEVLEGLADGDWVVLGPLSNLSDGDAVKAQKRGDG